MSGNKITIKLNDNDIYIKPAFVQSHRNFQWTCKFPIGSWISRIIYHWWILKRIRSADVNGTFQIVGYKPRGSFHTVTLQEGQKYYFNAKYVAAFTSSITNITTLIRFQPIFWCLKRHFFTQFTGPGDVILYNESDIAMADCDEIQPEMVMGFDTSEDFTILPAQITDDWVSILINLFTHSIVMKFRSPKTVVISVKTEAGSMHQHEGFWGIVLHFFSFLKF